MGILFLLLLLTLLLGSASAQSPAMDPAQAVVGPNPLYPDPDGILAAICELCGISITMCPHFIPTPFRRPTFTPSTFLDHPEWPGNSSGFARIPSPEPQVEPKVQPPSPFLPHSPFNDSVQRLDQDATTMQPSTILTWNNGVYQAGDRLSIPESPPQPPARRLAPRSNGYPCFSPGCTKTYNRQCDLRRHQKTHLGRSERPHKCTICHEGFLYPKDRERHERTHKGFFAAAPMPQLYCQVDGCSNVDGFSRRDNYLRHMRKQHPQLIMAM